MTTVESAPCNISENGLTSGRSVLSKWGMGGQRAEVEVGGGRRGNREGLVGSRLYTISWPRACRYQDEDAPKDGRRNAWRNAFKRDLVFKGSVM